MNSTPRRIAVLGSTGSVGTQALDVIREHEDMFRPVLLTADTSCNPLAEQIDEFNPEVAVLNDADAIDALKSRRPGGDTRLECGEDALLCVLREVECDIVLNAIVGFAGLRASFETIRSGKTLALANKESLVAGGQLLMRTAAENGVEIVPVDSEHSAIFQCLMTGQRAEVRRIILTASGGPFKNVPIDRFDAITPSEALEHPNWNMGPKISIDSATMMNKVLELIEARWIFDLNSSQIDVVIHPQSVVHSMVEFVDSSVIAQLSEPDMRLPILYALSYPDRIESNVGRIDFDKRTELTFEEPDTERFPALKLARTVLEAGGDAGAILNASNEIAVEAFLGESIGFRDITEIVAQTLELSEVNDCSTIDDIVNSDRDARKAASRLIDRRVRNKK